MMSEWTSSAARVKGTAGDTPATPQHTAANQEPVCALGAVLVPHGNYRVTLTPAAKTDSITPRRMEL